MVPLALLVGLVAGVAVRLRVAIAVGAVASLLWGLVVGVGDSSVTTFLAGTGLAFANFAVGLPLGVLARRILSARRPTAR